MFRIKPGVAKHEFFRAARSTQTSVAFDSTGVASLEEQDYGE